MFRNDQACTKALQIDLHSNIRNITSEEQQFINQMLRKDMFSDKIDDFQYNVFSNKDSANITLAELISNLQNPLFDGKKVTKVFYENGTFQFQYLSKKCIWQRTINFFLALSRESARKLKTLSNKELLQVQAQLAQTMELRSKKTKTFFSL